jgi:hypothetical protein
MKVKEMIEILKTKDPEADVVFTEKFLVPGIDPKRSVMPCFVGAIDPYHDYYPANIHTMNDGRVYLGGVTCS